MRICSKDIKLIRPGHLPALKRQEEPKKKTQKPLTEAQKRKVEALKQRIAEENRARLNPIPKGAEIRGLLPVNVRS